VTLGDAGDGSHCHNYDSRNELLLSLFLGYQALAAKDRDADAASTEAVHKMLTNEQINLIWTGVPYDPTGYGEEARGFIGMLDQYRLNLKIIPQSFHQGEDPLTPEQKIRFAELERTVFHRQAIVVQHLPANLFNERFRGRINIGRTMFETDRIPRDWVGRCNLMDAIWVPCHYNVETFAGSGVLRQKLRVVPGGVDQNAFHPAAPPLEPKQKGFVFLSVFGWFDHKGWDLLLTAYCTEFRPEEDVMLVIKTIDYMYHSTPIEQQIGNFINSLRIPAEAIPKLRIINRSMPGIQMPSLYTGCDAFVLPSRGEAWGRPYLEAMACGLPVIGTRWGGNLEFMNDDNSYLIEIEGLEDVRGNVDMRLYLGHKWARPSLECIRRLMRHVFEHRQEARAKGTRARQDVCQKWTWGHSANVVVSELVKYC
jgi:glycosyltransferase involved in cell wall biosynthesis